MALTKATFGVTNISSLSLAPNAIEGLTGPQLQALYDKSPADVKTYINNTLTTELDAALALKAPLSGPTFTGTVTLPSTTSIGNVSSTEIGYVDGVTSSIQTQLNGKANTDGWTPVTDSWTYASATTITVPSGAVSIYKKGDKLKLTQTTVKYFYIVGVADTLLTITGGSDYTLTNAAISSISYSHRLNPIGFPNYFNYLPTVANMVVGSGTLTARFTLNGTVATCTGEFILGSGSSIGTLPSWTTPITPLNTVNGVLLIGDTGTATYYGKAEANSGGYIYPYVWTASGTYVGEVGITSTVPMTWTTNDLFRFSATYIIA